MQRITALSFMLTLALAACAGETDTPAADESAPAAEAAQAATPQPRAELDLCTLMPASDVSSALEAQLGAIGTLTSQSGSGGMCSYRAEADGRQTVRLLIDFADFGSAEQVQEGQASLRQTMEERGMSVQDVSGVGDGAFVSREGETIGVKVRRGTISGQVNLTASGVSPDSVQAAAVELAKAVVARLP